LAGGVNGSAIWPAIGPRVDGDPFEAGLGLSIVARLETHACEGLNEALESQAVWDTHGPVMVRLMITRLPPAVGVTGSPGAAVIGFVSGTRDPIACRGKIREDCFEVCRSLQDLQQVLLTTPREPGSPSFRDRGGLTCRVLAGNGSQRREPVAAARFDLS